MKTICTCLKSQSWSIEVLVINSTVDFSSLSPGLEQALCGWGDILPTNPNFENHAFEFFRNIYFSPKALLFTLFKKKLLTVKIILVYKRNRWYNVLMLPAGGIPRSFNNSSVSARRSCDCAGLGESSAYSLKKIIIYPNILFNNNFALQLNFLQITVFTKKTLLHFLYPNRMFGWVSYYC